MWVAICNVKEHKWKFEVEYFLWDNKFVVS